MIWIREPIEDYEAEELVDSAAELGTEQLVIWTLLYTGLRVNEFAHMRASWVNFQSLR